MGCVPAGVENQRWLTSLHIPAAHTYTALFLHHTLTHKHTYFNTLEEKQKERGRGREGKFGREKTVKFPRPHWASLSFFFRFDGEGRGGRNIRPFLGSQEGLFEHVAAMCSTVSVKRWQCRVLKRSNLGMGKKRKRQRKEGDKAKNKWNVDEGETREGRSKSRER